MNQGDWKRRLERQMVLLVADFRVDMDAVRAVRKVGARADAAGLGGEAERAELAALGVDAEGVSEARDAVLAAALDRLALADCVVFGTGDWTAEREELLDAEREAAISDGRSLMPMIHGTGEQAGLAKTVAARAMFALARAAGAPHEEAVRFCDPEKEQRSGHKKQDRQPGSGPRSRAQSPRRRKAD